MSPSTEIRNAITPADLEHVRNLLREYTAHLATSIDPKHLAHRETELASLPGPFAPPRGALLLAWVDGSPAGCAALRPIALPGNTAAAEFCRLWVTPAHRGHHLGTRLLAHSIALARDAGYTALVLNSAGNSMQAAQTLYRRAGFRPIPSYKSIPIPDIAFFRLDLVP